MKNKMLEYLAARHFCVLSTVNDKRLPQSAFVGYSVSQGFEFMIGTSRNSRKFKNILANNKVSVVVADNTGEVQYEGLATPIGIEAYEALVESGSFDKLPGADKYRQDPNQVWLKVQPEWARFIQHGEVDQIEEFTEFTS